jgi:hypothetical protein
MIGNLVATSAPAPDADRDQQTIADLSDACRRMLALFFYEMYVAAPTAITAAPQLYAYLAAKVHDPLCSAQQALAAHAQRSASMLAQGQTR